MKRLLSATLIVVMGGAFVPMTASAHGGTYRGPGDVVPPGGSGSGGGGAAGPNGPTGPETPDGAGATTGIPLAPGLTPTGTTRTLVMSPRGRTAPDLTVWPFWWEFNKAHYIDLQAHVHASDSVSGSDEWYLGPGEKRGGKDSLRPNQTQIQEVVVPALLRALENETNNDIITGSMIALAKVGDTNAENGRSSFQAIIESFLADSNQEISETAAISLGILAKPSSIETLEALLIDSRRGRQLVKSTEVSYRTRAFASYALGLIGADLDTLPDDRSRIVRILADTIESDESRQRDLKVSCIISIGLVPLEPIELSQPALDADVDVVPVHPSTSRVAQLDYLLRYLQDEDNNSLVRAHCPTALARLLKGVSGEVGVTWRKRVADDLRARIGKRSKERNPVKQSAVLALGVIGTNGAESADIRKALSTVPENVSDAQARNFAMVAMSQVGGASGISDVLNGVSEASAFLLRQLARGKSSVKPWAGLGMGILSRRLQDADVYHPSMVGMGEALRAKLKTEKDKSKLGAYALACGIAGDQESEAILLELLEQTRDQTARGYVALSLGLMDAGRAIEPIQRIIAGSKYQPELLRQAAIALGLLGDKNLVDGLIKMLETAKGLSSQAAIASALGFIGDYRSIEPLVEMLNDAKNEFSDTARGFAAAALGIVADKEPLPWNSVISVDLNYRAATGTLVDPSTSSGILDLL